MRSSHFSVHVLSITPQKLHATFFCIFIGVVIFLYLGVSFVSRVQHRSVFTLSAIYASCRSNLLMYAPARVIEECPNTVRQVPVTAMFGNQITPEFSQEFGKTGHQIGETLALPRAVSPTMQRCLNLRLDRFAPISNSTK
jgi:hypothetical protein